MNVEQTPISTENGARAEVDAHPGKGARPLVRHDSIDIGGVRVFYREAGPRDAPAILLLHGFGASSFMFRELLPFLASDYRVVAPDLPGFGMTDAPADYQYGFEQLTDTIDAFTQAKQLDRYAMYVFDYGAPVGWRLAVRHPDRITAIVSQNGNAYDEGLSAGWDIMRAAWRDPSAENREKLRMFNTLDMVKWQYTEGVQDTGLIAPDGYLLAHQAIERIGVDPQLDLLVDYASNVEQYRELHAYFRAHRPPVLAIWGRNDPFFLPAGAQAFKRDIPDAEVHLLDTGHFALETHGAEIARHTGDFLRRVLP